MLLAGMMGVSAIGYTGYRTEAVVCAATEKTASVTATTLNVRTGPGTNYDKVISKGTAVFLKQGETAKVLSEKNGWYEVSFTFQGEKVTGFVIGDYVKITEKKFPDSSTGKDNADTGSSGSADKGGSTGKGDVSDNASSSGTEYLPLKVAGKVTAQSLRVRTGAGTGYKQLTADGKAVSLKQGDKVTITGQKTQNGERWYKVSFTLNKKNQTGYILGDYVTLLVQDGKKISVKGTVTKSLYARTKTSASKNYILTYKNKKMALKPGKKCIIVGEKQAGGVKWYEIQFYYGKKLLTGYVLEKYVDFRRTEVIKEPAPADPGTPDTGNGTTDPDIEPIGPDITGSENDPGKNPGNSGTGTEEFGTQQGIVVGGPVEVRVAADFASDTVKDSVTGFVHSLASGQIVTAYEEILVDNVKWYLITYTMNEFVCVGYVPASYVQLNGNVGDTSNAGSTGTVLSEAEFESQLTAEGFPESYKPYLRQLHTAHPYWRFEANQVGLDWAAAIENESKVGLNLIPNSKNLAWKSMETGAYNWLTDRFVPFDGSSWVTASKEAVEYYMDPRNFLTDKGIFQFELLSYQPSYQSEKGVETILTGTPMKGTSFTYLDSTGMETAITYEKTFMEAAAYSGVSPYHLASRSKQEVVTSSTTLSSSVTGKVNGYENLYNFYNIGAFHSTVAGGAVVNALKYALSGNPGKMYSSTLTFNDYVMIPWSDPYRSIVGGAAYIGYNYIQRGQNTVYLEKFNLTPTSTYSHQYMANVEGAASEAGKTAAAYQQMGDIPVLFSIPVYKNMPEIVCPAPADKLNPNNWLKNLAVDGHSLTPTFDPAADQPYGLIVDNTVSKITITAEPVNSKAAVTGAGTMELAVGNNTAVIMVMAENGDVKTYVINITREA